MPMMPPTHKPRGRPTLRERRRDQDAARPSSAARGYDARWRRLRIAKLSASPLCVECRREGRVEAATVVDHIEPHRGDDALRLDWDNLQSMCKRHHDQKTARQDGGFGRRRPHGGGGA